MRYTQLLPKFAQAHHDFLVSQTDGAHIIHGPVNQERIILKALLMTLSEDLLKKVDKAAELILIEMMNEEKKL